ncbi:hypothetical protein CLOM_g1494 [Closterium sp. NIES-68]|nr:hypothetical protein CLOM_g1494 [Closterium sp. NIES-68]GJP59402.1 hypothetical protein CLOP_g11769 [Closterium sp. NIES-67]
MSRKVKEAPRAPPAPAEGVSSSRSSSSSSSNNNSNSNNYCGGGGGGGGGGGSTWFALMISHVSSLTPTRLLTLPRLLLTPTRLQLLNSTTSRRIGVGIAAALLLALLHLLLLLLSPIPSSSPSPPIQSPSVLSAHDHVFSSDALSSELGQQKFASRAASGREGEDDVPDDASLYPDLGESLPVLRRLYQHNQEAIHWLEGMDRRLERDAAHLNSVLDRAIQQLSKERDQAEAQATVIDQTTADALLAATSIEEASAALQEMQATTVDLGKLAARERGERDKGKASANRGGTEGKEGKKGKEGEGKEGSGVGKGVREEDKSPLVECLRMYTRAQGLEKRFHAALQVYQQHDRELAMRQFMLARLKDLDGYRPLLRELGITAAQADATAEAMDGKNSSKKRLQAFLMWYPLVSSWFDREGPDHPSASAFVANAQSDRDASLARATSASSALRGFQERLLGDCGLRLPHSNWTAQQDEVLARFHTVAAAAGAEPQCMDWDKLDPGYVDRPGLEAPPYVWQKDPDLFPDQYPEVRAHFTFLLRYYGAPEQVKLLVDRLYGCTNGMLGTGKLPGVRAELLVNVFEPEKTLGQWMDMWKETDPGIFVVPVLPHSVDDSRGYNELAWMARGDLLVLLQDDSLPPESCDWLQDLLSAFSAWPRLGMVGYRTDNMTNLAAPTAGKFARFWADFAREEDEVEGGGEEEKGREGAGETTVGGRDTGGEATRERRVGGVKGMKRKDVETGVRMHFTGLVTGVPLVVRRNVLRRLGGLDEADAREGEAAIVSDWHLATRVWLSGYQVARLYLRKGTSGDAGDFDRISRTGYRRVTYRPSFLEKPDAAVDYGQYDAFYTEYHEQIKTEVIRLNFLLTK